MANLFVGLINFGIALLFGVQKANFFESFQLTLDVAGIFFDEFGEATHVGLKIRVFGINNNDFAAHSGCDKHVKHGTYTPSWLLLILNKVP